MKKLGVKIVGALTVTGATTLVPMGLILGKNSKATENKDVKTSTKKTPATQGGGGYYFFK